MLRVLLAGVLATLTVGASEIYDSSILNCGGGDIVFQDGSDHFCNVGDTTATVVVDTQYFNLLVNAPGSSSTLAGIEFSIPMLPTTVVPGGVNLSRAIWTEAGSLIGGDSCGAGTCQSQTFVNLGEMKDSASVFWLSAGWMLTGTGEARIYRRPEFIWTAEDPLTGGVVQWRSVYGSDATAATGVLGATESVPEPGTVGLVVGGFLLLQLVKPLTRLQPRFRVKDVVL